MQSNAVSICPTDHNAVASVGDDGNLSILNLEKLFRSQSEEAVGKKKRMKTEVPHIKPSTTLEGSTRRTLSVKWMNM